MAWASTEGATNSDTIEFRDLGQNRTEQALTLEYQPAGVVEKVGNLLHVVGRQAEHDLKKFKEFIEHEDHATGAWRESIPGTATGAAATTTTAAAGTAGKTAGTTGEPQPYNRFEHPFDQTGGLVDFEGELDETAEGENYSSTARRNRHYGEGNPALRQLFRPALTSPSTTRTLRAHCRRRYSLLWKQATRKGMLVSMLMIFTDSSASGNKAKETL